MEGTEPRQQRTENLDSSARTIPDDLETVRPHNEDQQALCVAYLDKGMSPQQ